MGKLKNKLYCSFFLLIALCCKGQDANFPHIPVSADTSFRKDSSIKYCITEIIITGNNKTRSSMILKEMPFKKGDSIAAKDFYRELRLARQQIYNLALFVDVKVDLRVLTTNDITITIDVKERWYLYPVPQFQPVDRNFNEWIKTYKGSLDRVNYGVKFVDFNLTGRKDQLRIYLINGYTRNISFSYNNPYSSHSLGEGFSLFAGYSQNHEISYKTSYDNKILEYNKGDFARNNVFGGVGYSIRQGLFIRHYFSISYTHFTVDDSIITSNYNPHYFNSPVSSKGFIDLLYRFQYTNVNNVSYPLQGTTSFIQLTKRNLGISSGVNMFGIEAAWNRYYPLGKSWYSSIQANGKIKLPFEQAYINQRGLGYGDTYLRGLEYYVIDGVATALVKSTIKKKIGYFSIPFPFHSRTISSIPFTFYAKTYADLGYAYNKKTYDTYLNNRLLYTGGFGLDILTLYDVNLRIEYSFNQLHENGLFLHNQAGF